jgi:hypothetical protein
MSLGVAKSSEKYGGMREPDRAPAPPADRGRIKRSKRIKRSRRIKRRKSLRPCAPPFPPREARHRRPVPGPRQCVGVLEEADRPKVVMVHSSYRDGPGGQERPAVPLYEQISSNLSRAIRPRSKGTPFVEPRSAAERGHPTRTRRPRSAALRGSTSRRLGQNRPRRV